MVARAATAPTTALARTRCPATHPVPVPASSWPAERGRGVLKNDDVTLLRVEITALRARVDWWCAGDGRIPKHRGLRPRGAAAGQAFRSAAAAPRGVRAAPGVRDPDAGFGQRGGGVPSRRSMAPTQRCGSSSRRTPPAASATPRSARHFAGSRSRRLRRRAGLGRRCDRGQRRAWPMVQMEWVDGRTLDAYVGHLPARPDVGASPALAHTWRGFVARLQAGRVRAR